jgi:hypothetical protein
VLSRVYESIDDRVREKLAATTIEEMLADTLASQRAGARR